MNTKKKDRGKSVSAASGQPRFSRRDFLKSTALLGGSAALASQIPGLFETVATGEAAYLTPQADYLPAKPEQILYSVCQQCNTQ